MWSHFGKKKQQKGHVTCILATTVAVQCINNKHNDNDRESEDGPFDMTAWMGVTRHRRERYIIGQERSGTMIRRINDLSVPQTH